MFVGGVVDHQIHNQLDAALVQPGQQEHTGAVALLRRRYVQYQAMPIEQHPVIAIRPTKVVGWPNRDEDTDTRI
jgi:hypothetical protein